MNSKPGAMQHKRLIGILLTATIILLIPFIGMQLTEEVNWTRMDFVVAGVLFFGTGLLCEFVLRNVTRPAYRIAALAAALAAFVIIWLELAAGILGTPFAGS